MCGKHFVFGQDAVDGRAERGLLDLLRDVSEDVAGREVRADTVARVPARDLCAERDDLACRL